YQILYLPSTRRRLAIEVVSQLLQNPQLELVVVTGRNENLHEALVRAGFDHAPHVRLIGWTDQMPELLASSHLFCGKPGGAIVQEAIAAQTPFLVTHVVPGQEEGNAALLERIGAGRILKDGARELPVAIEEVFANDGKQWKEWKRNLLGYSRPDAARRIARFLMDFCEKPS
ncbi:MAG: glycosyltransferase, partial [Chthoniobacterales bacterium]|nr:glycosyltransferase [Chthoniobacterales bacterium]